MFNVISVNEKRVFFNLFFKETKKNDGWWGVKLFFSVRINYGELRFGEPGPSVVLSNHIFLRIYVIRRDFLGARSSERCWGIGRGGWREMATQVEGVMERETGIREERWEARGGDYMKWKRGGWWHEGNNGRHRRYSFFLSLFSFHDTGVSKPLLCLFLAQSLQTKKYNKPLYIEQNWGQNEKLL